MALEATTLCCDAAIPATVTPALPYRELRRPASGALLPRRLHPTQRITSTACGSAVHHAAAAERLAYIQRGTRVPASTGRFLVVYGGSGCGASSRRDDAVKMTVAVALARKGVAVGGKGNSGRWKVLRLCLTTAYYRA